MILDIRTVNKEVGLRKTSIGVGDFFSNKLNEKRKQYK